VIDLRPSPGQPAYPIFDFVQRHPDLLLCGAITLLAAILRLWALGEIPSGIHADEAQVGLDARRILSEGWIGPYTWSALGQPSGHAYLTAPSIWLFGSTAWALRLPLALTGVAAIPLAYVLFRMLAGRIEATFAALLLATSLWHLHFSRVAHWPISYGTVALLVLILWQRAIQTGDRRWFVAAGGVLGLGLYTYNVYPVFVLAFAVWVGIYTFLYQRSNASWRQNVALAAGVSLAVGLPLFVFIATHADGYFDHYQEYYERYSVLRSDRFEGGGRLDKADVLLDQLRRFAGAYIWQGVTDRVDGSSPDGRPMLDPITVALSLSGLSLVLWHWRAPASLLVLCLFALIPLAGALQTNATYRGTLGLAPFVAFLAALPLGLVWREAGELSREARLVFRALAVLLVLLIGTANLTAYFDRWAGSAHFDKVYARDFTNAVEYVRDLPDRPYVYLLSSEFRFSHETRLYLAPDVLGEDRSTEFIGRRDLFFYEPGASVVLLLNAYANDDTLDLLREIYPGGDVYIREREQRRAFVVYTLPESRLLPP
jgi:4-amino-4-deoxy-L-arabinose transferase-like glycosyltransferase